MEVNIKEVGSGCRVELSGDMTIKNATELKRSLSEIPGNCSAIELAMEKVMELDTSGVQLLLALNRTAAETGRRMSIVSTSTAVDRVLDTYRIRYLCTET